MSAPRILIGGIFLESHSFSPALSDADSFLVTEGEALLQKLEASDSLLAGGARALAAQGATLLPTFSAVAPPGGLARHDVYLAFRDRLVAAARTERPDAIFLELHGAMGTTQIADSEGDLAAALREAVGPHTPIAAGLDMHACVTRRMLAATPLWVACKENPHTDYAAAGARAAGLLLDYLRGDLHPVVSSLWLPLLLRGRLSTGSGPLADLHAARRELERAPGIADISFYNTYAFLDSDEAGQCVTVLSDGRTPAAAAAASSLAHAVWARRGDFEVDRPSAESVLAARHAGEGCLILGDHGDRVLGGSAGDGTYLLNLLRTRPDLKSLIPVTDPAAVAAAEAAGVGASVSWALGGGVTPDETPVEDCWTVRRLAEGRFLQQGPFLAHEPADMGPSAVLEAGSVVVLATSKPAFSQDPACFLSAGEDPADYDIVVCKSGFHFEPAFATYGRTVSIDSPGITNYVPGRFAYRRRQPLWPEDPGVRPDFKVHSFSAAHPAPLAGARP